jgi:hypothetical protein
VLEFKGAEKKQDHKQIPLVFTCGLVYIKRADP